MKIKIQDLSFKFRSTPVINRLSFTLEPGSIISLLGPNGAGKSTLLRILNGYLGHYSGKIYFDEIEFQTLSVLDRAKKITYVGAELETDFPVSVEEYIRMGRGMFNEGSFYDDLSIVMEETGCKKKSTHLMQELSSGERQRVHLARALYQKSKWICLDESFSKLDLHHQVVFGNLLKKYVMLGYSFIFVSHDLNFTTDWADRCILLKEGEVVADGATSSVLTKKNLSILYPDTEIYFSTHPKTGALKIYFGV